MPDILIRDVPEADLAAVDANAARTGLSRSEYVRRLFAQERGRSGAPKTTLEDLQWVFETFADLRDPDFVTEMWR